MAPGVIQAGDEVIKQRRAHCRRRIRRGQGGPRASGGGRYAHQAFVGVFGLVLVPLPEFPERALTAASLADFPAAGLVAASDRVLPSAFSTAAGSISIEPLKWAP